MPNTVCIAALRPTPSPGLYRQMAGRGSRTHPGKTDGLVLDFGGNSVRHEPADPTRVQEPGTRDGAPPVKECPKCHILIPAGYARCPDCGFEFSDCAARARDDRASGAAALSSQIKQLLGTRHRPSVNAGGPIRGRRRPLRTPAASAMLGFFIGVLWRYQSESRSA